MKEIQPIMLIPPICSDIEPTSSKECLDGRALKSRGFGKETLTIEYLEKYLETIPKEVEGKKILIVGTGVEPSLSKHLKLFVETALKQGVEVVYSQMKNTSELLALKIDSDFINGYRYFQKEKHIPIKGKSSKKGKTQTGSKFHK